MSASIAFKARAESVWSTSAFPGIGRVPVTRSRAREIPAPASGTELGRAQAERSFDGAEGTDHESDMIVQRHAELFGTAADVVTVHAAGERLVLQFLLDGRDLEVGEALRGTDQRACDQEPAELVHRKERLREGEIGRA